MSAREILGVMCRIETEHTAPGVAQMCAVAPSEVEHALNELEASGMVRRFRRPGGDAFEPTFLGLQEAGFQA